MNTIKQLTDNQLIKLLQNQNIDSELKRSIIFEIDRRDIENTPAANKEIDFNTKAEIFFTSYFLFKRHLLKSSKLLNQGNQKGYKQYWRFFIYGIIFYIILLLLIAKYFLKPSLLK